MKALIVGGLGRSGTSLLYRWMAANPNAVSFGNAESKLFSEPYGLADLYRGLVTDYTYARGLVACNEFRVLSTIHIVDAAFTGQDSVLKNLGEEDQARYHAIVADFLRALQKNSVPTYLTEIEFKARTLAFMSSLIALFGGRPAESVCFVEKTPHNALCPWIYEKIFDQAKFVWIIRDPRAVVYSTLKQDWGPSTLDSAIEYVRQVSRRYMDAKALVAHLEVRLEDLVYNTPATIEHIQRYCEFGLHPGIQPPKAPIIEDWKNYLYGDDLIKVETELRPEIAALGY